MYTIGSILWQLPRSGGERARLLGIAAYGIDEIPHLAAVSAEFQQRDPDEFFRSGLETVLNGLEKTRGR